MNRTGPTDAPLLVLFSQDRELAQTRHWVLEQAGFRLIIVRTMHDLSIIADRSNVAMFLLCNSLSADLCAEASRTIRERWNGAKVLVFTPSYPVVDLPVDVLFPPMEGPAHLVRTVQTLVAGS